MTLKTTTWRLSLTYCAYVCVLWINTTRLSIPSEGWVGIHYDLSHIQCRIYSILVALTRMWHQKAKRPSFSLQILNVFSLGPRPSWVVSRKQCYIHQRHGVTAKYSAGDLLKMASDFASLITCFPSPLSPLFSSFYLSLFLSYLSLPLINSHYPGNNVTVCHTLPWAMLWCVWAHVSQQIDTDSMN